MNDEITYMSKLSDDELWAELGALDDNNIIPPPFKILVKRGKEWFENNKSEIREIVCNSEELSNFRNISDNNIYNVIASFGGIFSQNVSIAALVVLLSRIGLDKFCKNYIDEV
ncbi:hypothetical protein ATO12_17055 [Aquimarina atlantica]|uniref:Uncharacterized protein n=1 Tax=Aquimarina atlantica TaxID=1317122 RepID=A0A023BUM9_9FLAO|nr:hypothetical protein [Aquimarina atlantica]EZH73644.1 hypothetical protein ATO12_17055 [Aquimarina atlantica]